MILNYRAAIIETLKHPVVKESLDRNLWHRNSQRVPETTLPWPMAAHRNIRKSVLARLRLRCQRLFDRRTLGRPSGPESPKPET